ncbi:MAG: endonuclease III, partial [Bowdeniella nasicola]|nr:endonuclease III [Bowdeniella nasicola]
MELEARALAIDDHLRHAYPDAACALRYRNAFELLVATVLSAQTTDARVNMVTATLFQRFPTAHALAGAAGCEVEAIIRPLGFFRQKTRSLLALSAQLVADHDGQVPQTLAELTQLRGVGRKTANVVLGNAFGIPAITVDTHVGRLARRMGLTDAKRPEDVERDLARLWPQQRWTMACHRMIAHGRQVCRARRANCQGCVLTQLCP